MPDDTVLRAALRTGIGFPYECNSGGCGSCRFQLLEGEVVDLWVDAPGRSDRDRRTGRLLACQSRAATDAVTGSARRASTSADTAARRPATLLVTAEPVTHDIRRFLFVTDGPAEFRPGQYASLSLPGVAAPRYYSMSNVANADGEWEFMVRRVPAGARRRCCSTSLAVGDYVELDGPYGLAWLRAEASATSFASRAVPGSRRCCRSPGGPPRPASCGGTFHFFYGARTADRRVWAGLPRATRRVRHEPASIRSSRHPPPPTDALGRSRGFVHDVACSTLADRLADVEWYFAGPPPMTQALQHER